MLTLNAPTTRPLATPFTQLAELLTATPSQPTHTETEDLFSMEAMYPAPTTATAEPRTEINGVRWDAVRARFRSTVTGRYVRRPHALVALELMGYQHRPGAKGRVVTGLDGRVVADGRGGWVKNVDELAERVYREAVARQKASN